MIPVTPVPERTVLSITHTISALLLGFLPHTTSSPGLHVVQFSSDSSAYDVGSTLIMGPTESVLIDAQYHWSNARRVADRIAATNTHLKAIFITHPDVDHYMGAAAFVERFPGTPVYMTESAIEEFKRTSDRSVRTMRLREPNEAPDSLVTPQVLPDPIIEINGERVVIMRDEQGDVLRPTNSYVWIPSLRTVIAGDIVFNGVYPWLAASDVASRRRWRESIQRIANLHPLAVIAGHKKTLDTPDSPALLGAMDRYLTDFDAARAASPDADSLEATMKGKYPGYVIDILLEYSSKAAYSNKLS